MKHDAGEHAPPREHAGPLELGRLAGVVARCAALPQPWRLPCSSSDWLTLIAAKTTGLAQQSAQCGSMASRTTTFRLLGGSAGSPLSAFARWAKVAQRRRLMCLSVVPDHDERQCRDAVPTRSALALAMGGNGHLRDRTAVTISAGWAGVIECSSVGLVDLHAIGPYDGGGVAARGSTCFAPRRWTAGFAWYEQPIVVARSRRCCATRFAPCSSDCCFSLAWGLRACGSCA